MKTQTQKKKKPEFSEANLKHLRMIRASMKAMQKLGVTIVDGDWGVVFHSMEKGFEVESGSACALGALLAHKDGSLDFKRFEKPEDVEYVARRVLGVKASWVDDFILGFDASWASNGLTKEPTSEAYRLGKRLRHEFKLDRD